MSEPIRPDDKPLPLVVYDGLVDGRIVPRLPASARCNTVFEVVATYLPEAKRENTKLTFQGKVEILNRIAAELGTIRVVDFKVFHLHNWLNSQESFASEWTRRRVVAIVKRAFNWCLDMDLIDKNPIARYRSRKPLPHNRKPMADEDFQALMRASPPHYRRVLTFLKFTGCRPGEASSMKWEHVRFEQRCVILHQHKTSAKTGKPRIIPLVPTTLKMLAWMKRRRQVSVIGLMEKLLRHGPVKGVEMVRFLSHYGISDRGTARAREAMGVIRERVGGTGPKGYYTYRLPDDYVFTNDPPQQEYVFVTCLGNPLNKCNLALWMKRTRRRAGLPDGITLYMLRHRYGFMGIKNNVNLKLLSLCMGHADTKMTEHYIDSSGLGDEVMKAAVQVAYGQGAYAMEQEAIKPVAIPTINPPSVEDTPVTVEHLPKSFGNPRPRPYVRPDVADAPLPAPGADPGEQSVESMLRYMMGKLSARKPVPSRPPTTSAEKLNPTHDQAYQAIAWAVARNPALATAIDREVYDWLMQQPDCPFKLPPTLITFTRYVTAARHYHGTLKRILPCHKANGHNNAQKE